MADGKPVCGGEGEVDACRPCGEGWTPSYWCDTCEREVGEKRCPLCGLKARRMRGSGEGG